MNRIISLLFLLSLTLFGHAKDDCCRKSSFGEIKYKDDTYESCCVRFYNYSDSLIVLSITPQREHPRAMMLFDLNFSIKASDIIQLPNGLHRYDKNDPTIDSNISESSFVWNFREWDRAVHIYETVSAELYIRQFDEERTVIAGNAIINNRDGDTINFIYSGKIEKTSPEVMYIEVFDQDDFRENKGQFSLIDQTISTPFAFQKGDRDHVKIFITDRNLIRDANLEYGMAFELSRNGYELPTGVFTVEKDFGFQPSFFDKEGTKYPDEATLSIKNGKNKKEYIVEYSAKLDDGRVIKGNYRGLIPDRSK